MSLSIAFSSLNEDMRSSFTVKKAFDCFVRTLRLVRRGKQLPLPLPRTSVSRVRAWNDKVRAKPRCAFSDPLCVQTRSTTSILRQEPCNRSNVPTCTIITVNYVWRVVRSSDIRTSRSNALDSSIASITDDHSVNAIVRVFAHVPSEKPAHGSPPLSRRLGHIGTNHAGEPPAAGVGRCACTPMLVHYTQRRARQPSETRKTTIISVSQ